MNPQTSVESCGCGCAGVDGATAPTTGRRTFNAALLATALSPLAALAQTPGATGRPKAGQMLAFAAEERSGQQLKPTDIALGADPVLAYPMEPGGAVLQSRGNMLAVARVPVQALSPEAKALAPDGIVAFSAVCTHYGCPVTKTDAAQTHLICNCHGSAFDVGKRGVVVKGPATRRLAMLPLKLEGSNLVIAGGFDGPIGPPT